jgi:hypothetical protein
MDFRGLVHSFDFLSLLQLQELAEWELIEPLVSCSLGSGLRLAYPLATYFTPLTFLIAMVAIQQ